MSDVTCSEIEERLPWFLHGSLGAAERGDVESHLAACPRCREALAATREASALFAGHPGAATLVDYAFGLPLDPAEGLERSTLELHLAHCADCREELRLVAADRTGPTGGRVGPDPAEARSAAGPAVEPGAGTRSAFRRVQILALAAVLVVAAGLSVWFAMHARMPVPDARIAIVELLPADSRTRSAAGSDTPAVRIDRRVATTLLLVTDRAEAFDEVRVRLGDPAAGEAQWQASGLQPVASGAYALLLPAGALRPGEVGIELEGRIGPDWTSIALYRVVAAP